MWATRPYDILVIHFYSNESLAMTHIQLSQGAYGRINRDTLVIDQDVFAKFDLEWSIRRQEGEKMLTVV